MKSVFKKLQSELPLKMIWLFALLVLPSVVGTDLISYFVVKSNLEKKAISSLDLWLNQRAKLIERKLTTVDSGLPDVVKADLVFPDSELLVLHHGYAALIALPGEILTFSRNFSLDVFDDFVLNGQHLREGAGTVEAFFNGTAYLTRYTKLNGGKWLLLRGGDRNNVYDGIESIVGFILIKSVALFFVLLIVAMYLSKSFSRPVLELANAMKQVFCLEKIAKISVTRKDQIGELQAGFNRLITNLRESQDRAVESSKLAMLGEISAEIAHDIRTPLTVIKGRAQQLKIVLKKEISEKKIIEDILDDIANGSNKIKAIVDSINRYSRKSVEDCYVPVSLSDLVSDATTICIDRFEKRNIAISFEDIPEVSIKCRESELIQVLTNLLNNAFDEVLNHENPWVRVGFALHGTTIEISVTDSGKGISTELQQKIMQAFFTTKEVGKGTGLGLSISKRLVEQHGGELLIDSSCSNTKFVVRLPVIDLATNPGGELKTAS